MSVSAETYIVISLMFAVFAAVAAVGTSVVLGAGFERLRAGFEVVRRQSGFFADAIHKLDQRTQKLDEEAQKVKAGIGGLHDRMDRVEKQATFMIDAVGSMEQKILDGTPTRPDARIVQPVTADAGDGGKAAVPESLSVQAGSGWVSIPTAPVSMRKPRDTGPESSADIHIGSKDLKKEEDIVTGSLLTRYFTGDNLREGRGAKGVIFH